MTPRESWIPGYSEAQTRHRAASEDAKIKKVTKVVILGDSALEHQEHPGIQPLPHQSIPSVYMAQNTRLLSNLSSVLVHASGDNPEDSLEEERQLWATRARGSLLPRLGKPV